MQDLSINEVELLVSMEQEQAVQDGQEQDVKVNDTLSKETQQLLKELKEQSLEATSQQVKKQFYRKQGGDKFHSQEIAF